MRKPRKIPPAYTGTTTRMKSLPYASVSSPENFESLLQELMLPDPNRQKQLIADDYQKEKEGLTRKCVYTYEDKYAFTRIIYSDSFVFDSHFESGNLHSAFRVLTSGEAQSGGSVHFRKHVYDLYMHNDLYTSGNTQWFYFRVSNIRAGQEVTFYLKNFQKPDSLYNQGMRPLMFSTQSGRGWERCGLDIRYYPSASVSDNPVADQGTGRYPELYSLSFKHQFEFNDDLCYFAYCLPYTYTDLQRFIFKLQSDPANNKILRRRLLCKSMAGNLCDLLTITAPADSLEQLNSRVVIIISARVHPGESNSSWIVHGMIRFLTSDCKEAAEIRQKFIFKIIPMLNPDGVINGNYRTSLAGCDLNRKWSNPDINRHPTIFHTKALIIRQAKIRSIGCILDLHGHSRKKGIFVYGCIPDKRLMYLNSTTGGGSTNKDKAKHCVAFSGGFDTKIDRDTLFPSELSTVKVRTESNLRKGNEAMAAYCEHNLEWDRSPISHHQPSVCALVLSGMPAIQQWIQRLPPNEPISREILLWKVSFFPRIFAMLTPSFVLESCSYKMHKSKAGTMRIVAFAELGIDCVYTVESSLAGSNSHHYLASDLMQMGQSLCCSLLVSYPSVSLKLSPSYKSSFTFPGLLEEVLDWRRNYDPSTYSQGAKLLSEAMLAEMINGTDEQYTDDSDNDTIALERASKSARKMTKKSSKAERKVSQDKLLVPSETAVPEKQSVVVPPAACDIPKKKVIGKEEKIRADRCEIKEMKEKSKIRYTRKASKTTTKRAMELSVVGSQSDEIIVPDIPMPRIRKGIIPEGDNAVERKMKPSISSSRRTDRKSHFAHDHQSYLFMDDNMIDIPSSKSASEDAIVLSNRLSEVVVTDSQISESKAKLGWLNDASSDASSYGDTRESCSARVKSEKLATVANKADGNSGKYISEPVSPFTRNYGSGDVDDTRVWSSVVSSYLDLIPEQQNSLGRKPSKSDVVVSRETSKAPKSSSSSSTKSLLTSVDSLAITGASASLPMQSIDAEKPSLPKKVRPKSAVAIPRTSAWMSGSNDFMVSSTYTGAATNGDFSGSSLYGKSESLALMETSNDKEDSSSFLLKRVGMGSVSNQGPKVPPVATGSSNSITFAPHGEISFRNVGENPTRKGSLSAAATLDVDMDSPTAARFGRGGNRNAEGFT